MLKDDLIVITSYFNPQHYVSRYTNYGIFRAKLQEQNIPCFTVECVLGDGPPELEPGSDILLVRTKDSLWQKERLLNIALDNISSKYTKISWLDCDVLFPDALWADKASDLLDKHLVIQPFDYVVYLLRGETTLNGTLKYEKSFCAAIVQGHLRASNNTMSPRHGHTGFAWAARRELLIKHHFYDSAIIGSGDHLMAHAVHGGWDFPCLRRDVPTPKFFEHYQRWAIPFYQEVQEDINYLKGNIYHLWHGEPNNRSYGRRGRGLANYQFDPETDLKINPNGAWEWASSKLGLHDWVSDHFKVRREDGDPDESFNYCI